MKIRISNRGKGAYQLFITLTKQKELPYEAVRKFERDNLRLKINRIITREGIDPNTFEIMLVTEPIIKRKQ